MKKLKQLFMATSIVAILIVFTVGFIFSIEIVWRLFYTPSRSALIDVTLFPYKHYLVSTHPANLELGNNNHILNSYFSKGECVGPDNVTARFNSDGFRTHDLRNVPEKAKDEIRIIITGGSVAISWNIGEACTLDAKLYRLFEEKYPNKKVRIFNLGNGAWKSFQELLALQLYGIKLKPDLVIAFDGNNDILHAFSMPIEQPYSNTIETAFKRYQRWMEGRTVELFKNLKIVEFMKQQFFSSNKSHQNKKDVQNDPVYATAPKPGMLATYMEYPFDLNKIADRTDFDPYNQEVVDFYLKNEKLMAKAASIHQGKIIFVLAPTLYLKNPLSPQERITLTQNSNSANFVIQGYLRMRDGLQALAGEETNAYFYDMTQIFDNQNETIFSDSGHFSQQGYDIVANKLFEKVEEVLNLKN